MSIELIQSIDEIIQDYKTELTEGELPHGAQNMPQTLLSDRSGLSHRVVLQNLDLLCMMRSPERNENTSNCGPSLAALHRHGGMTLSALHQVHAEVRNRGIQRGVL